MKKVTKIILAGCILFAITGSAVKVNADEAIKHPTGLMEVETINTGVIEENDIFNPASICAEENEELASEWVEELMGKKHTVTCDPTVLWEPSFWDKFVLDGYAPKGKYVLIYAVNPDKRNISDGIEYAKKKGIPAYFINFYTSFVLICVHIYSM